jgi:hypothetical protein
MGRSYATSAAASPDGPAANLTWLHTASRARQPRSSPSHLLARNRGRAPPLARSTVAAARTASGPPPSGSVDPSPNIRRPVIGHSGSLGTREASTSWSSSRHSARRSRHRGGADNARPIPLRRASTASMKPPVGSMMAATGESHDRQRGESAGRVRRSTVQLPTAHERLRSVVGGCVDGSGWLWCARVEAGPGDLGPPALMRGAWWPGACRRER